jgi:nucleotide-binding universal stress UspA family protein/hemerythrin-like domain-containing protein
MYRHLLVPIDDSDLSVELIGNAVGLARSVAAHVTFFHAIPDHSSSLFGDADVVRLTSPQDYAYAYIGRARELLAKAEAAARASGVACNSMHVVSDKPAAAIVSAAHDKDCDLIFMASHGRHSKLGMALTSEMLSVVMDAGLPVLVSSTKDPKPPARAIGIIRDEHRSLAAVLHAWTQVLATARTNGTAADPVSTRAIVHYLQSFPVALHHPKEEEHLFKRLRERTQSVNGELDELERQHERDHRLVAELEHMTDALGKADDDEARIRCTRTLEDAVLRYATFMWEHLGREEGVILPAAQRHLTDEDWTAIEAAFVENRDPRFDVETDREYRMLFSRIVNLAEG